MKPIISVPDDFIRTTVETFNNDVKTIFWDMKSPAPTDRVTMAITPLLNGSPKYQYLDTATIDYIQCTTLGYEAILPHLNDHHTLMNGTTVHETATAELTLAHILAMQRNLPRAIHSQANRTWDQFFSPGLADKHVLLIGVGGVGTAIMQRLEPFEVELTRVGTTARDDAYGHVHATSELPELLPNADIVILIVPATPKTIGMVDDDFLSRMKDNALLVNMARGSVVDTDAMVRHLPRLRFAFDVVHPEPLPADHPLYVHPNVLITAHSGGYSDALKSRLARLIQRQITHLLNGEPLENIVRPRLSERD